MSGSGTTLSQADQIMAAPSSAAVALNWPGPRTVLVPRTEQGFGFTLRHFIVYPPESAVSAQFKSTPESRNADDVDGTKRKKTRLSSLEPMDTIFVRQVKESGPAHKAGLNTGDRIVSVNGQSVTGKTYSQVIALIQATDNTLQLLVVPKDEDILQMTYQNAANNQSREAQHGQPGEIPPPPHISRLTRMQTASYAALQTSPTASRHPVTSVEAPPSVGERSHFKESPTRKISTFSAPESDYVNVPPAIPSKTYLQKKEANSGWYSSGESRDFSAKRTSPSQNGPHAYTSEVNRVRPEPRNSRDFVAVANSLYGNTETAGSTSSLSSHGSSGYIVREPRHTLNSNTTRGPAYAAIIGESGPQEQLYHTSRQSSSGIIQVNAHTLSQENNLRGTNAPLWITAKSVGLEKTEPRLTYSQQPQNTVISHLSTHRGYDQPDGASFRSFPSEGMEAVISDMKADAQRSVTGYRKSRTTPGLVGDVDQNSASNNRGGRYGPALSTNQTSEMALPHYSTSSIAITVTSSSVSISSVVPTYTSATYIDTGEHLDTTTSTVSTTGVRFLPAYKERFEVPKPHVRVLQKKYQKSRSDSQIASNRPMVTVRHGLSPDHVVPSGHSLMSSAGCGYSQNTLTYSLRFNESPRTVDVMSAAPPIDSHSSGGAVQISSVLSSAPAASSSESVRLKASVSTPDGHHIDFEDPKHLSIAIRRKRDSEPTVAVTSSPSNVYYKTKDLSISDSTTARERSAVLTTSFLSSDSYVDDSDTSPSKDGETNLNRNVYCTPESSGNEEHRKGLKPFRQPSYLTAMNSPSSKVPSTSLYSRQSLYRSTLPRSFGRTRNKSITFSDAMKKAALLTTGSPDDQSVTSSEDTAPVSPSPPDSDAVVRRNKEPGDPVVSTVAPDVNAIELTDVSGNKVVRRTSYLMATSHDRVPVQPPPPETIPEVPATSDQFITPQPKAASNIKKLKHFFGEKTPRILEATDRKPSIASSSSGSDPPLSPPGQDVGREGILQCKLAVADGKRASDRSWRPMWAALRGHALYLFRDRKDPTYVPGVTEEHPLSVKSSIVDIAYDYTKKKHVFRLTTFNGSEYLFQADDHEDMIGWINAIQTNNNPDDDDQGVVSTELILRKTAQVEHSVKTPTQPPASKSMKKMPSLSFRRGSPGASNSPNVKHRKSDDGPLKEGKEEKTKTWRGKLGKSIKRLQTSSSGSTITETDSAPPAPTGAFSVPLEDCIPSTENELVPLVVEMCCSIVEARGLEVIGIYRVPGNTAAVNTLQEELNKGIINGENEKWLDINVVGSLLKCFFRKLPDPLITEELYQSFIKANRNKDPERRMLSLKRLIHDLPDYNYDTFKYLANHLHKVASHSHINKMDSRNLAIVFGPTLVRAVDNSMVTMVEDMSDQCRIVESVIHHCDWIFASWDSDVNVPIDDENGGTSSPVSGMNDILTKMAKIEESDPPNTTTVSRKDIVTSIIQAANKKIKKKDKDKKGAVDLDASGECGFEERNIDEIVAARRLKIHNHVSGSRESDSSDLAATDSKLDDAPSSTRSDIPSSTTDFSDSSESRQTDSILSEVLSAFQKDYTQGSWSKGLDSAADEPAGNSSSLKPNQPTVALTVDKSNYMHPPSRTNNQFAESSSQVVSSRGDSLPDQHDVEVMYFGGRGTTNNSHERSRRLEYEAKILRAKEAEQQREQERRDQERRKIEEELQRTRRELECDDDISLEDIDAGPSPLALKISDITSKINDLSHGDSSSVTSDYSTTSSSNLEGKTVAVATVRKQSASDYSSSTSPTGSHEKRLKLSDITKNANSSSDYRSPKEASRPLSSGFTSTKVQADKSPGEGQKPYGKTHLSLYTSGPSVASRIHAFEEKKAPLLAYRRSASSTMNTALEGTRTVRRNSMEHSRAIFENLPVGHVKARKWSETRSSSLVQKNNTEERPHSPFVRVGSGHRRRGSLDSLRDFYDPDLAKRCSYASSTSEDGHDLLHSITATFDQKLQVLVNPKYSLDVVRTRKSSGATSDVDLDRGLRKSKSAIGVLETFKDPSLHRLPRSNPKVGIASRFELKSDRRVSGDISSVADNLSSSSPGSKIDKLDSSSPEVASIEGSGGKGGVVRRRNKRKELRRRHTVGGMKDFDQFKDFLNNQSPEADVTQLSAWERLQPAVKSDSKNEMTSMKTWMEQQRLKAGDMDVPAGTSARNIFDSGPSHTSRPAEVPVIESRI